jgi:hypothetical protein
MKNERRRYFPLSYLDNNGLSTGKFTRLIEVYTKNFLDML